METHEESQPKYAFFSAEEKLQLLNGNCPRNITKQVLRSWLSYRVGTSKNGSASADGNKRELVQRVVSYIKNGWDANFTEKWMHLSGESNENLKENSANANEEPTGKDIQNFLPSTTWTELKKCNKLPEFSIANMMSYFITRRARDDESNKDYKSLNCKAFGLFRHGHVQNIKVANEDGKYFIQCECLPEMKKTLKYKIQMTVDSSGDIIYGNCNPCPAGKPPLASCKHLAALCFALEEYIRLGRSQEFLTCTERLQTWNQPRKRKLEALSVYDIDFSRKVFGTENLKHNKALHDPRLCIYREPSTEKANQTLLQEISRESLNCGFYSILSKEPLCPSSLIVSPIKEQPMSLEEIHAKAKRIKSNLFVGEKERELISRATKNQSDCQKWFEHRKTRITASKCKRVLQRPDTSPTKAVKEILHLNDNFQSNYMKQGLTDEANIIKSYENLFKCNVSKLGFVISSTHPFLGASPDGEVDNKCLVEVKRVFPGTKKLAEAVCSRGICKRTVHGLLINTNHPYHFQVQQQLFCVGLQWADLVISDLKEMIIISIKNNLQFRREVIPKLESFYDNYIAVELAYPRLTLGLPRLGKVSRLM